MKTIALFGATGQTGREFLGQALEHGYRIRALVRTPEKLRLTHPNLEVLKGDVLNPGHVSACIAGADCVVSLFGHVKGSPEGLQTRGTEHIIQGMKAHGVAKIISLSGGALPYPEQDQPKFIDKFIRTVMGLLVPKIVNDAIAHHQVLAASGLRWVIVRAPRLTNQPRKGSYRVGWVGVNASTQIARADLADFIVRQVEDDQFVGQLPFVSY